MNMQDLISLDKHKPDLGTDLAGWLAGAAVKYGLKQLLAHADDGVIWGFVDADGRLRTGHEVEPAFSPPLRKATLQQCRLFGPTSELLLWRDGPDVYARLLQEKTPVPAEDYFDEPHIVWGTQAQKSGDYFSVLTETRQNGLRHVVPIPAAQLTAEVLQQGRRLRLQVRHYFADDAGTGEARIALSRLVELLILPSNYRSLATQEN